MKLLIITDAWKPQINGVVTTYTNLIKELSKLGVNAQVVQPSLGKTFPLFFYKQIDVCLNPLTILRNINLKEFDSIHIATEGPLGLCARILLSFNGIEYTTAYHTRFPEYFQKKFKLPQTIIYFYLRWFHKGSKKVFTSSKSHMKDLKEKGFKNLTSWSRGIDPLVFKPQVDKSFPKYILYVGRVSDEKNIKDFLKIDLNKININNEILMKVVIGDGPDLEKYMKQFPDCIFLGSLIGDDLAKWYSNAIAFVFPSRTDTFGIVNIESLACGTPVAAYPTIGPIDIIKNGINGCLFHDLEEAINECLRIPPSRCIKSSEAYRWDNVAKDFILQTMTKTNQFESERLSSQ